MTFTEKNAASYVETPKTVDVNNVNWSDEADILIVGFGGAGACAAIEAKEQGADVLALERFEGGGATCLSGGIIYSGGTPYQKAAGIEDSAEEMFKYLRKEIGDAVMPETLRRFCEQSSDNLAWLNKHGVNFGSCAYSGKRSYPPKGFDIYYSGNEATPAYAEIAKPAARGHRVAGHGYTGKDFYLALQQSAVDIGVRVRTHTLAKRLLVNEQGDVVGVEVLRMPEQSEAFKKHLALIKKVNAYQRFMEKSALKSATKILELEKRYGESLFIRAKKAVVLTTGSFAFNREMVSHYAPKYKEAMPLGTVSCDGSGVLLGQSVGAAVGHMDSVTAWRSISPPESFVKSVVVNKEGQRFIAEDAYLGHLGYAIANQTEQRAWVIIDSSTYWRAYKETIPHFGEESYIEFRGPLLLNLLFNSAKGKTLTALAKKIGVDSSNLEQQVSDYNDIVAQASDPLNKKNSNLSAIGKGPFYAIDISVGSKKYVCPTIPMGGLQVNEDTGQVITSSGQGINGLYAAGRAAVGVPSGFYVSGSSIADCVFSGRRAAQTIMTSRVINESEKVEA